MYEEAAMKTKFKRKKCRDKLGLHNVFPIIVIYHSISPLKLSDKESSNGKRENIFLGFVTFALFRKDSSSKEAESRAHRNPNPSVCYLAREKSFFVNLYRDEFRRNAKCVLTLSTASETKQSNPVGESLGNNRKFCGCCN